jgi:predicted nucleic acid-binding protein
MRLFLDTSVMLSAAASGTGASRELFRLVPTNGWLLVTTHYAIDEVLRHLPDLPLQASVDWAALRPSILVMDDVFTVNLPVVFPVPKDKPILFGALAWADVLLTLDHADFGELLGESFYGMPVLKPGVFLKREREAGRLKPASNP